MRACHTISCLPMEEAMQQMILVLNVGSSSVKFSLFLINAELSSLHLLFRGEIADLYAKAILRIKNNQDEIVTEQTNLAFEKDNGLDEALSCLLQWITAKIKDHHVIAIGHRIVHG